MQPDQSTHPLYPTINSALFEQSCWRIASRKNYQETIIEKFSWIDFLPRDFHSFGGEDSVAYLDAQTNQFIWLDSLLSPEEPTMSWNVKREPLDVVEARCEANPFRYWKLPQRTLRQQGRDMRAFARLHLKGTERARMLAFVSGSIPWSRIHDAVSTETVEHFQKWELDLDASILVDFFLKHEMEPHPFFLIFEDT